MFNLSEKNCINTNKVKEIVLFHTRYEMCMHIVRGFRRALGSSDHQPPVDCAAPGSPLRVMFGVCCRKLRHMCRLRIFGNISHQTIHSLQISGQHNGRCDGQTCSAGLTLALVWIYPSCVWTCLVRVRRFTSSSCRVRTSPAITPLMKLELRGKGWCCTR